MSKYRIRIFSSFGESDNCKGIYERLCEADLMDNYGPDKEIYITNDDDYTHVILMNTPIPNNLKVSRERVVGLAFEPPAFLTQDSNFPYFMEYARLNISKYLIGSSDGLPSPFISGYSFMWHITPPRRIVQKTRPMSIMVSEKSHAPGHIYRHSLVKAILQSNLNIDIYGRGCRYYSGDSRLKGDFSDDEPYEQYEFHICIENFQTESYTSEKYTNCILWGTTPIYWGATNIDTVFPNITIHLSRDLDKDMRMLSDILSNPNSYKKPIIQEEIRPKMNLLKNLDNIFS
jgi:Glycosyltransferase family 10 (fucosyltransferase) C-term